MNTITQLLQQLGALETNAHQKDFLLTWEQTRPEIEQVLKLAEVLKRMRGENIATRVFNSGLGVSVFRDNSTRTRFSYASALNLLGLAQQDLDEGKSQIAHGETVRETANMISLLRRRDRDSRRYVPGCRRRLYARGGRRTRRWFRARRAAPAPRTGESAIRHRSPDPDRWPIWPGCKSTSAASKA